MKWLDRVREKNAEPTPQPLTELTKGAFVSSVSAPPESDEIFQAQRDSTLAPPPDLLSDGPCRHCGSRERWRWRDGRQLCRPCLMAGEEPIMAVKVWSDSLGEAVWVVADNLPREEWPTDAPAYTQTEGKILCQVGPDTIQWVHATKQMFGAEVVKGDRRPVHPSHIAPAESASNDGSGDRNVSEKRP